MKLPLRITLALLSGTAVFWFARFAGWLNSLTTQRTPFYWTLNHISAWAIAAVVFICVIISNKD